MRDLVRFIYKFKITFLFLILQVFSFYLLFSANNYHRTQWFSATNSLVGSLYEVRHSITSYADLKEQNLLLAEENQNWRNLHKSAYTQVESKFVRIQDSIFMQQYKYLNAEAINYTTGRKNNYITLNKGSKQGVDVDMGVINSQGIVGKVIEVSENYSTAMSVLHQKFTATVKSTKSGHKGFVKWNAEDPRTAAVEDVARHAPISQGDIFVTRGSGGIFPEGAMVGVVEEVGTTEGSSYHDIKIELSADLDALGHVFIVMDLTKQERQELEEKTEEEHAANGN